EGAGEMNADGAIKLAHALRKDALLAKPGENLLPEGVTLKGLALASEIAGEKTPFNHDIIYSDGILFAEGIIFADGILFADGFFTKGGSLLPYSTLLSSGILFADALMMRQAAFRYEASWRGQLVDPTSIKDVNEIQKAGGSDVGVTGLRRLTDFTSPYFPQRGR